jgi:hypothetical protein
MNKLQEKMYYSTCGFILTGANYLLIDTRFNLVGIGFGFVALYFFVKALRIKPDKK